MKIELSCSSIKRRICRIGKINIDLDDKQRNQPSVALDFLISGVLNRL